MPTLGTNVFAFRINSREISFQFAVIKRFCEEKSALWNEKADAACNQKVGTSRDRGCMDSLDLDSSESARIILVELRPVQSHSVPAAGVTVLNPENWLLQI
jgi:hypothetical protein